MIALALCVIAFLAAFWAGRRSLPSGLIAVLAAGYFYGILRANLLTPASHFIFDASLLGLYLSQGWGLAGRKEGGASAALRLWTIVLIVWPVLVCLMPFQPLLVSIVGLRGNTFFLPILLLGSRLKDSELLHLSAGIVVLNVIALGFAMAEYFTSVQRFYPPSPVTSIIYSSGDAGGGFFRIPAIFSSAHAFGGTMVATLPYLIGSWIRTSRRSFRHLVILGVGGTLLGILMSSTRLNFVLGCAAVLATVFGVRMKTGSRMVFVLLVAALAFLALTNVRFQRFKSLTDAEYLVERMSGSVNRNFWEILVEFPMGNGLGGGGTSLPYFLQNQVRNPIGLENEYARILCEQGVVGLLLWLGFILWFLSRIGTAWDGGPWRSGRRLAFCLCSISVISAVLGTGMLTSIPGSILLLLSMGWISVKTVPEGQPVAFGSNQPVFAGGRYA